MVVVEEEDWWEMGRCVVWGVKWEKSGLVDWCLVGRHDRVLDLLWVCALFSALRVVPSWRWWWMDGGLLPELVVVGPGHWGSVKLILLSLLRGLSSYLSDGLSSPAFPEGRVISWCLEGYRHSREWVVEAVLLDDIIWSALACLLSDDCSSA